MFPHRETTTVKKSKFQATAAIIESSEDVKKVLSEIHQNKKFKKASHHIYAYIVAGEEGCNDDGETGASIRILKMLHSEGYNNVLVCVTRWYGGVKMGPERFRVITKCAREHLKSVPELN